MNICKEKIIKKEKDTAFIDDIIEDHDNNIIVDDKLKIDEDNDLIQINDADNDNDNDDNLLNILLDDDNNK